MDASWTRCADLLTAGVVTAIIEAAPDAMLVCDADGLIVAANEQVERVFGYARAALFGRAVEVLIAPEHGALHQAHRQHYATDPKRRPMGAGMELSGRRRDGSELPVDISLSPLTVGSMRFTIANVRDVTASRAHQLATRAARAADAVADDRERIARDVHDTVIRRLFGAGLTLEATCVQAPELADRLHGVVEELDEAIRELRLAVFHLSARDPA